MAATIAATAPKSAPRPPSPSTVDLVRRWGERRSWGGWDPYDALNTPYVDYLTLGTALGRRCLTQLVKRSPANLRPLLGIRPGWNEKAVGLVASGYARLFAATSQPSLRHEGERWLAWLADRGSEHGFGWGYHFAVQTRFFRYPAGTPNTIATSFVAQAQLDGWDRFARERWLDVARSATQFMLTALLRRDGCGRRYFAYLPGDDCLVHNANALASAVVVRTGLACDDSQLVDAGLDALKVTVEAQRDDGSWLYAASPQGAWIDNFHTAYVLEALATCAFADRSLVGPLLRGAAFWAEHLFTSDDRPRYTPSRTFPLDAHCYADAVEAWNALVPWHRDALRRATRAADVLAEDMVGADGRVTLQRGRFVANRVPCIRWSAAPAFRALAGLEATRTARGS